MTSSLLLSMTALGFLFVVLGIGADVVVKNIKIIADKLGISVFILGIVLGLLTSLPEIAIGINSLINNVAGLAVGNLLGGIVVLFGLILGASIVLNRTVGTDDHASDLIVTFLYLLLPVILGANGVFGQGEGLLLVVLYLAVVWHLYRSHRRRAVVQVTAVRQDTVSQELLWVIFGIVAVALSSNLIIRLTSGILQVIHVSPFLIGVLVFSLGTNLPELIVTITSWRRRLLDLSLSNLLGSAMANILALGLLSMIRPIALPATLVYWTLGGFMLLTLFLVVVFYHTGREFSRAEGIALLLMYFFFLLINIFVVEGGGCLAGC
ncbi:hypothetical protein HY933_01535 [Candidatus Falkowbacteria bacterium]|nr:hypothetical protein [Candidatus Falkowbacteria bacterium]